MFYSLVISKHNFELFMINQSWTNIYRVVSTWFISKWLLYKVLRKPLTSWNLLYIDNSNIHMSFARASKQKSHQLSKTEKINSKTNGLKQKNSTLVPASQGSRGCLSHAVSRQQGGGGNHATSWHGPRILTNMFLLFLTCSVGDNWDWSSHKKAL